jgi:hypothetical protein
MLDKRAAEHRRLAIIWSCARRSDRPKRRTVALRASVGSPRATRLSLPMIRLAPARGPGTRAASPALSTGSSASPPSRTADLQAPLDRHQSVSGPPILRSLSSGLAAGQRVGSAGARVGREVPVQEQGFRLAPEDLTDHLVVPVAPLGSTARLRDLPRVQIRRFGQGRAGRVGPGPWPGSAGPAARGSRDPGTRARGLPQCIRMAGAFYPTGLASLRSGPRDGTRGLPQRRRRTRCLGTLRPGPSQPGTAVTP